MEEIKYPIYCSKKTGNDSKCACFATQIVDVANKKDKTRIAQKYRCEKHKESSTVHTTVLSSKPIDQSDLIKKLNSYLSSLVGKKIKSSFHRREKVLVVQYLKGNGAVMCLNPYTRKYRLVYHKQIQLL